MESGNKKRKMIISPDDEDDYQEEEEKMEKFYALVKGIREARDCFITNNNNKTTEEDEGEGSDYSKSKISKKRQMLVWKPSFQREDFMDVNVKGNKQLQAADHREAQPLQLKKKPQLAALDLATTTTSRRDHDQSKEETHHVNHHQHLKQDVKEALDLTLSL